MRRVILAMHVSLDGFVAGPNGELDWVVRDKEIDDLLFGLLSRADTALLGRVLYEGFAKYWPSAEATNPSLSKGEIEFAHWIDEAPKIVFSKTLESVEWKNSRIVQGDIAEEIARLRQQPGKDFAVFGGATFAQALASRGLIDEYRLLLNPVILGSGKPLFRDIRERVKLRLVESRAFKSGAIALTYQPIRESP